MSSQRSLRVFLCHASDDKPAVRKLYQRLRTDGIDAWLDEENLLPGQDWEFEIPKAVRESDAVIVCLSKGSVNRAGYMQKEIKFALDVADQQPQGAIFLIPLKLEECAVPDRLGRWQWVDFFTAHGYERLLKALQSRISGLGLSQKPIGEVPRLHEEPLLSGVNWLSDSNNCRVIGEIEFVRVPAGKFLMGSKDKNLMAEDREKPRHSVVIPYDYWMARYPVTNDQFVKFVEGTVYNFSLEKDWRKKIDHPVVNVSWYDALEYCKWMNNVNAKSLQMTTAQIRLPSEAEWEMAARGKYGNEWPWGNEFDQNKCNSGEGGKDGTMPVGSYSPQGDSPYGIADMVGNVWEWCHSLYAPYPYASDKKREDETASGSRVLRGGSYNYSRSYTRCAYRDINLPGHRYHLFGFRMVVAPRLF